MYVPLAKALVGMENGCIDDESFLVKLNGFLQECDALQLTAVLQAPAPTTNQSTALLQDTNQLLAETEVLLASYDSNTPRARQEHQVPTDASNTVTSKLQDDNRREIKNQQAAKRRLKYRAKLKTERQTLGQQEKTLSEQLETLQHARKKAKSSQQSSIATPLWKTIATRQMDGRQVAEEQQRRLKNAVASRAKAIQEVDEMMRQQICDDITLFEEYVQDMDVVYQQTDETFQAFGVEENSMASCKLEPEWKRDGDLEYFENLDVSLIPFSFEQTCNAMWQALLHVHQQKDRQHYRGVTDPENTIAVKCRIPSPMESGERVDMLIHLVTKRYLKADRMVIVWRALTEGDGEFSGLHSDKTGWCVVRRNKIAGAVTMPTVMQTFIRFIPMTIATTFGDKARADQFAKLVVTSGEEDGMEISRMMESLLINDSMPNM